MIAFENSYLGLSPKFFRRVRPTPVAAPVLVAFNHPLAAELGLDVAGMDDASLAAAFSGNAVPAGAEPIALAYAAHQFGQFVPQLGDGRAILLGERLDRQGRRRDVQLKGSGQTPFSRNGDGRAALGPVLREYVVSEAMHALGVPTTRALAAVLTGEEVYRETVLPGAVVTRVAASHLRIGTFQYFAARGDEEGLAELLDFAIARHDPDLAGSPQKALDFLDRVMQRQASLVARWMGIGFIHGVMNTDNMTISGETIDYGPCAFMDAHDPRKVFSSIDRGGRYGFQNQPGIAQWNLARLAETLLPLIDADGDRAVARATECLDRFPDLYAAAWLQVMRAKCGLMTARPEDARLFQWLLGQMHQGQADFTLTFRALHDRVAGLASDGDVAALFANPGDLPAFLDAWRDRQAQDGATIDPATRLAAMRQANPAVIPRNHQIEAAIVAGLAGDFTPFHRLVTALQDPFDEPADALDLMRAPRPEQEVLKTFCGT